MGVWWKVLIWLPYINLFVRDNKLRDLTGFIRGKRIFPEETTNKVAGRDAKVGRDFRRPPATLYLVNIIEIHFKETND